MKNLLKLDKSIRDYIKVFLIIFIVINSLFILLEIGFEYGGGGVNFINDRYIRLWYYQLLLSGLIFYTTTIVLPKYLTIIFSFLIFISSAFFIYYSDDLGFGFMIFGLLYAVAKVGESKNELSRFGCLKSLNSLFAGMIILSNVVKLFEYNSIISCFLLLLIISFTMLITIFLYKSINKIIEISCSLGLIGASVLHIIMLHFISNTDVLSLIIGFIFLLYITFFQNEKYQNQ